MQRIHVCCTSITIERHECPSLFTQLLYYQNQKRRIEEVGRISALLWRSWHSLQL
jgi:hypothetical protein